MNALPLVCLISPSRESVPSRWSIGNSILKTPRRFPAFPHGKRQHVVETLNLIDQGTASLVDHHVRSDFTAETALEAVAQTFAHQGLPTSITLDRDTRWVGALKAQRLSLRPGALLPVPRCHRVLVRSASSPTRMDLWNAIIARSTRSAWCRLSPRHWMRFAR